MADLLPGVGSLAIDDVLVVTVIAPNGCSEDS